MADQRRRGGRGRSGRGGRIPRKGEGQGTGSQRSEAFISFPLEVKGPIRIQNPVDAAAVAGLVRDALEREQRLLSGLQALVQQAPDEVLSGVQSQVTAHRGALEALYREMAPDASLPRAEKADGKSGLAELVTAERLSRVSWIALQRAAYAAGDRRLDEVVKPVLREKERHAEVIEQQAVRALTGRIFREDEI